MRLVEVVLGVIIFLLVASLGGVIGALLVLGARGLL